MEDNNKKQNSSFSNYINNNKVYDSEEVNKKTSSTSNEFDDFGDDFDDFEFDVEGFASDQQLSLVDEVSLEILEKIVEYSNKIIDNIKFQEKSDAKANFNVLANYCSGMAQIMSDEEQTDEDLLEKLRELKVTVADITYANMNNYAEEYKDIHGLEALDICPDSPSNSDDSSDDTDDLF